jgi:Na+(H+)/acetate symporter ActP
MFGKIIRSLGFGMAWAFAIVMASAIPFLLVSMVSERLGRNLKTSVWLGIVAGAVAVYVVVINRLLTRSYQKRRTMGSHVIVDNSVLVHMPDSN